MSFERLPEIVACGDLLGLGRHPGLRTERGAVPSRPAVGDIQLDRTTKTIIAIGMFGLMLVAFAMI